MSARSSMDYMPLTEALEKVKTLDMKPEYRTTVKILVENKATVVIGNKRYITRDTFDQIVAATKESECRHRDSR